MKTTSSSVEGTTLPRDFGILDTLVLMLAAALFATWILGTLFLSLFPSAADTNVAGSQSVALADSAAGLTDAPAATESQDSSNATAAASESGDPNAAKAIGGASSSNQRETGEGLADKEKTELKRKVSTLQRQLDTKSKELAQLRKKSAKPNPRTAADTSKFEKQIALLKKGKSRLDREIKKLKGLSANQKKTIQTLQNQLFDVTQADSTDAQGNLPLMDSAPPTNQPLEFRDWISSQGNKARLAFVRWEDGDIIVVNEANKTFRLTLNRLSPEDQTYVNSKR